MRARPWSGGIGRLRFSDQAIGAHRGDLFGRYRFTAREDASSGSEAAVDPEMLGKAFESLMAAADRRESGAFFHSAGVWWSE